MTEDPKNTAYLVGDTAVLSCSVSNPTESDVSVSVMWYKLEGNVSTLLDVSLYLFDLTLRDPATSSLTFAP